VCISIVFAELDPWGADAGAAWSSNSAFQPRKFTTYDRDGNGSDEAMFRRYNRWHSRFDQPDPYDGSYHLTNPQSFNRYAYVQNDPVNFVDPLGLDRFDDHLGPPPPVPTLIPDGGDTIVTNIWGRFLTGGGGTRSSGAGGTSSGPIELETPSTPTEAEIVPQSPAAAQTDCQRFADLVQAIANRTNSDDEFLDEMARTFTAANNSSIADMRRTANTAIPAGRPRFVDSGFKPEFQDGSNQVRHFTAGFIAGARLGVPGLMYMNSREGGHNPSPGNEPDVRLNGVSTNLGSMYTKRPDAVEFRRARLAGQIREDVCQ
jgi:RHS repeat-associated protein